MRPTPNRALATAAALVAILAAADARADADAPGQGEMLAIADDGERAPLPLVDTEVRAEVDGFVSRVRVRQTFGNPYEHPIEAIYVFPLPHRAAVSDMTIEIDDRVIRADVQRRDDAKRTYEKARAAGQSAALLEQERPNVFTQSVANIRPGNQIVVEVVYDDLLDYEDGEYELVFPMVVGPRYTNASVADADRITPPVVPEGYRTGNDISIEVDLAPGVKVRNLRSPTHRISIAGATRTASAGPFQVKLASRETIPNKDFVLRWEVAGTKPQVALLSHRDETGGYFALMLQPPAAIAPDEAAPKEVVFVLDTSGSMSGTPIAIVKRAMRHAISNLNPNDTFRIVRFSNSASALSDAPLRKTRANVARALKYIDRIRADGGTEMLTGVREALDGDPEDGRLRMVLFLSDGYIGNETRIFEAVEQQRGPDTRVFTFGVGSSVNRYLIDGMADAGAGSPYYALLTEPPERQVEEFYARIADPVMTHVEIDWGDLDVDDVTEQTAVDLFVGQPLWVVGRYDEPGDGRVSVRGRVGDEPVGYTVPVALPTSRGGAPSLPQLWARTYVAELAGQLGDGDDPDLIEAITRLGLDYRIATRYTSFVAVDSEIVNDGGLAPTVEVPVEMPEGVSYEGVYGTTLGQSYVQNTPVPGRSYGTSFAGSTSVENSYVVDGVNTGGEMLLISGGRDVPKTLRIGGGLAFGSLSLSDRDDRTSATLLHVRLSRAVTDALGLGARLSFLFPGGEDADLVTSLLLEALYLPLFDGHLVLGAGAGAALPTDGDIGLSYLATAAVPLRIAGGVDLALQLRYDGARWLGEDDTSLSSLSLGLAVDW